MFTKRTTLIISLILMIFIFSACSQGLDPQVSIGAADAGKTVNLHTGDTLVVTLDGNITTGYNWIMLPQDSAILEQVGEPQVTPDSDALGAGGKIVLNFKAVKTGQSNLNLAYMRSFETDATPENTFEVLINVE